jgi:sodium-dependent dicarboxylate transporter 2/3/5
MEQAIKNYLGLILGPLLFVLMLFIHPVGMSEEAKYTLGITLWMAVWWISESVPIAITAFLPLVLFPLMGILKIDEVGAAYGDPVIFLFISCFMLATAIERWNLHRRIALNIIKLVGTKPSSIILGFMLATGFLSMWLSNTATTIMMLPIGLSLIKELDQSESSQNSDFTVALLLGIAYASSIGGIATLIGTPTNIIFVGAVAKNLNQEISFVSWMLFALPPTFILLLASWFYLVNFGFKIKGKNFETNENEISHKIDQYIKQLGKISFEEICVAIVFGLAVLFWILRAFFLKNIIPNDSIIAIIAMTLLFIIPAKNKPKKDPNLIDAALDDKNDSPRTILDWDTAVQIPWAVILLFGGGLALALAFEDSGLAKWIGESLEQLQFLPFFIILLIVVAAVNFLTEITSNVATVSMVLPVLLAMSVSLGVNPYYLMIGATCAASCAFMLPVATAPNAIVYGTNKVKVTQMIKAGFALNIISIIIYTLSIYYLVPLVWNV